MNDFLKLDFPNKNKVLPEIYGGKRGISGAKGGKTGEIGVFSD